MVKLLVENMLTSLHVGGQCQIDQLCVCVLKIVNCLGICQYVFIFDGFIFDGFIATKLQMCDSS